MNYDKILKESSDSIIKKSYKIVTELTRADKEISLGKVNRDNIKRLKSTGMLKPGQDPNSGIVDKTKAMINTSKGKIGKLSTGTKVGVGVAALGAAALWKKIKKNKCKQNCLKNPDPSARQNCLANC